MRFHKETPQNDYLDTLSFSRVLLPNLAHHRLSNLCEYYDIDNNGIKELILGIKLTDSNKLIPAAIYTHTSNYEVKKLYYQNTIERGNLSIYDNGTLYSIGSGGAALHYYGFYKIASDGTSLETLENIREEYITDNTVKYYNENNNNELSYKNLDEITGKYINAAKEIELTATATIN